MPATDDDGNPFRLPESNQWFFFQEQEVHKREEELEKVKHQRVWEKTTATQNIRQNPRADTLAARSDALVPAISRRASSEGAALAIRDVAREKGGVQAYVAKKHEVFLAQMSLDVKREEIVKLKEEVKRREEALRESQRILAEDSKRFDDLFTRNDQKLHEAMKAAEDITKRKQEKQNEIKQLKLKDSTLQSEIAKLKEDKDECLNLKAFLEKLTPKEFKDEKLEEKHERQRSRRKRWVDERLDITNAKMQSEIAVEERAAEERAADAAKTRRRQRRELEEEQKERERDLEGRKRRIRKRYPTREQVEAEHAAAFGDNSSEEDLPPFFQEPKQLLDVFTAMEEANLFLIQNTQDTEQALEELQQKLETTKRNGAATREKVNASIQTVDSQVDDEKRKCAELRQKIAQQRGASDEEVKMRYLCDKALEVSAACGHEAQAERDPDTLQLLAAAESKLEEFISTLDEAEASGHGKLVKTLEGAAETRRREMLKRLRKEHEARKQDERLKSSLQRSQAPIHKKTGKQIMFRSPPVHTAQRVVEEDDGYEEAVKQHKVFGIWTDRDGAPQVAVPVKKPS